MNFYCTFLLIFSFFMGSLFPVKIRKEKSVSMNAKRRNRMKKKHIQCKRNHWNTSNTKDTKAIWYTFWKKHLHKHFVAVTTTITPITNIKEAKKKINLLSTWSIRMTGKKSAEKCVHMKGMTYKKMNRTFKRKLLTYDCMSTKWHCCYCHYHHQRHH